MALTPLVTICLPTRDLVAAARFYREGLGLRYAVERARAGGGAIVSEGAIHDWGYSATFEDLDGHLWMVTVARHA